LVCGSKKNLATLLSATSLKDRPLENGDPRPNIIKQDGVQEMEEGEERLGFEPTPNNSTDRRGLADNNKRKRPFLQVGI
jgi:hypothetical protein